MGGGLGIGVGGIVITGMWIWSQFYLSNGHCYLTNKLLSTGYVLPKAIELSSGQ